MKTIDLILETFLHALLVVAVAVVVIIAMQ